jgi:hypothetical protein
MGMWGGRGRETGRYVPIITDGGMTIREDRGVPRDPPLRRGSRSSASATACRRWGISSGRLIVGNVVTYGVMGDFRTTPSPTSSPA